MNRNKNGLIYGMVCLGAAILALRLGLYTVAMDGKNLITPGNPLSVLIWVAAAAGLVLAAVAALRTGKKAISPVSTPIAALGDGIFALAIGLTVFAMGTPFTVLEKLLAVVGYLCVPALLYAAFCRFQRKPVFFGCFAVVCVFFALLLVARYQDWSSNPQLQDYVFAMLACVAVTLFAYQNTAALVKLGSRRVWLASGMLAVCYGIAAIYRVENGWLCGAGAVWAVTTLLGEFTPAEKEGC